MRWSQNPVVRLLACAHVRTTQTHNLCLPEDVRAQFFAFFQNALRLFRWDVDLQRRGERGLDEAADDGGNLLLDGDVVTVGVTEVLHTERKREVIWDLGQKRHFTFDLI